MLTHAPSSLSQFDRLVRRHKARALGAVAVLATLGLLASQAVPGLQDLLIAKGVFACLTLLILIDLARSESQRIDERALTSALNQDEAMPMLLSAVAECRRESIELLEYAGMTTLPLIRAIQREGASLKLLMKHPDTVDGIQRQRMIATLDTLYNSIFDGYEGEFEARCYRQPYGLRGRRLGNRMLELGWLTPDYRRQTAYGHANPSIVMEALSSTNQFFFEFFDRTFDELWSAPDTEDAEVVLARSQSLP